MFFSFFRFDGMKKSEAPVIPLFPTLHPVVNVEILSEGEVLESF